MHLRLTPILSLWLAANFCSIAQSQVAQKPGEDVRKQAREILQDAAKDLDIVEDPFTKFRGLARCAVLQAKSGDAEASRQSFLRARDMIKTFWPGSGEYNVSSQLAEDYAEAGNVKEMKEIIEKLPAPGPGRIGGESLAKGAVVRRCAIALAKGGKDKEALDLAKIVTYYKPEEVRDDVLREIALRQAKASNWKAVQATVASISEPEAKIRTLAGITFPSGSSFNLSLPNQPGIALIQDQQGDPLSALRSIQQAQTLVKDIKEPKKLVRARANILCAQAALGNVAGAQDSLAQIPDTAPIYAVAMSAIANAQAKAGQEKAALETIDKLTRPGQKANGLAHVVVALAQSGNVQAARAAADKALELALTLPEQEQRDPLFDLARARAIAKDFEGAIKTVGVTSEFGRGILYANIAYWQGVAGDLRGALKTVDEHRNEPNGAWAENLGEIAHFQLQHGQDKEALAWVRQQTAPEVRAYGLLGVAKGLLEHQKPVAGR